jgi:limonene-1,2-epoxide hydrolase
MESNLNNMKHVREFENKIDSVFPKDCVSPGKKMEYISRNLLPAQKFDLYLQGMEEILAEDIHYIDPVHEVKGRDSAIQMFREVVPRAANDQFQFHLISETEETIVWRWTIELKIRWTWIKMKINGLVHAQVRNGKIVYQREYFDPMESIEVIPIFGKLYKLILKLG